MKDGRMPKLKVLFTVFKVTTGYSRYLLPCRQRFSVLKKSFAEEDEDQFWSFVASTLSIRRLVEKFLYAFWCLIMESLMNDLRGLRIN